MGQTFNVSFPNMGIENIPVDRIAFSFDLFGKTRDVYWYGIIMAVAFLVCMFLSIHQAPQHKLKKDDIVDTYLLMIPLSIIGARLYFVAFSWDDFKDDLMRIFQTRHGGLAFYGGVIGGILALVIIAKWKKINFIKLMDFFAVYVPLGQGIGRWGNFVNQEAFGVNTDLPWGMISEGTRDYLARLQMNGVYGVGLRPDLPVHPTFFYEFIGNMLIFFILLIVRRKSERKGTTFLSYLLLYGILRAFVEGLRTDSLYIANTDIRVSQFLSILMVAASIIGLLIIGIRKRRTPVPASVTADIEAELEAAETIDAAETDHEEVVKTAKVSDPAIDETTHENAETKVYSGSATDDEETIAATEARRDWLEFAEQVRREEAAKQETANDDRTDGLITEIESPPAEDHSEE